VEFLALAFLNVAAQLGRQLAGLKLADVEEVDAISCRCEGFPVRLADLATLQVRRSRDQGRCVAIKA
jgi:hypothetical protein